MHELGGFISDGVGTCHGLLGNVEGEQTFMFSLAGNLPMHLNGPQPSHKLECPQELC